MSFNDLKFNHLSECAKGSEETDSPIAKAKFEI